MSHKIFICHANEDKPKAIEIYNFLKEIGYTPWLDKFDIVAGQDWKSETRKHLITADFVIILFSNHSIAKRGYVQREFKWALETLEEIPQGKTYIIPIRLEECTIPAEFKHLHYIDLFQQDGLNKIEGIIGRYIKQKRISGLYIIISSLFVIISLIMLTGILNRANKEKIAVGRIIDDDDYLLWLKRKFEEKYPNYTVEYIPKIGEAVNQSTPVRFLQLDKNKEVQIFLGGALEFHEVRRGRLGNISSVIEKNSSNIQYFDSSGKWMGYYQKLIGVVWNNQKFTPGFVIRSVNDLLRYSLKKNIIVPSINTSAASDFFFALGVNGQAFNSRQASLQYRRLLDSCFTLESTGPEATRVIAKLEQSIAVEWPQDALALKKELKLDCISVAIFKESVPSISCISVISGNETKQSVIDFLNFAISPESQQMHYEKAFKFPISEPLLRQDLLKLKQQGKLAYFPEEMDFSSLRWLNPRKYLDSLPGSTTLPLDYNKIERVKNTGCE